ncbi:TspO/MBR family protein [Parerythrobacter aurantius]|uniref:TspO/MBR family protein n=1 Tax=Parerythrobacter aurantius TaxID=3127706 RepID=UPI003245CBE1
MNRAALLPVVIAAAFALITAVVGSTITVLDQWYYSLEQPKWAPPDYLFGIIWTAIFALIALAAVVGWQAATSRRDSEIMVGLFALNGFLNILWSFLFFRLQRPDYAFYELLLLWLSIAVLIWFCGRFSKGAALLLLPYLAWVTIAGALNWQVVQLNGPFG